MTFFRALARDFLLIRRRCAVYINAWALFALVILFFPLSLIPEGQLLRQIAPGILWVAVVFANLLCLPALFQNDEKDGTLAQMLLIPGPLAPQMLRRVLMHWGVTGLPLVLLMPLIGPLLMLPWHAVGLFMLVLALGTLILSLLGALLAAILVSLPDNGLLLAVLILPLSVPLVIFGSACMQAAQVHAPVMTGLAWLTGICALSLGILPDLTGRVLRLSV